MKSDEDCDPRLRAVAASWARADVPVRFRDVEPAEEPAGWAYITGPVGTGKTRGACRLLRRWLLDNARELVPGAFDVPTARFVTAPGYLRELKLAFDGRSTGALHPPIWDVGCLVLDDLGQENPTAWAVGEIFELVNYRDDRGLPIIVTSQFSLDSIARRLAANGGREQAEAIQSRLAGMCRGFKLSGPDRRCA